MGMGNKNYFTTLDLNLVAYLTLYGLEPSLEKRSGKIIFIFDASDELYRLINEFNSNRLVPVNDYVTKQKILRGKLIQLRNEKGYENGREKTYSI
jgi:hypothetical protein